MHVGPLSCNLHHSCRGDHAGPRCRSQCRTSCANRRTRLITVEDGNGSSSKKKQLAERIRKFSEGRWLQLQINSEACAAASSTASLQRRRNQMDTTERRTERAQSLVKFLLAHQALAQGTVDLLDTERRPTVLCQPLTAELHNHRVARFLKNLKCARRGPAAGPSGMTADHTVVDKGISSQ